MNWKTPWAKQPPWTRPLTGLVVSGNRILCSSIAFGNHLLVEVQKLGRDARTPGRVVLQDFTGVPAVVDLAAMRDAVVRLGGKADAINSLAAEQSVPAVVVRSSTITAVPAGKTDWRAVATPSVNP